MSKPIGRIMTIVAPPLVVLCLLGACATNGGVYGSKDMARKPAVKQEVATATTSNIRRGKPRPPADASMARALSVSVYFSQRLIVPAKAKLAVQVMDASGARVGSYSAIMPGVQPYSIKVPIGAGAKFPLNVVASLDSPIGHLLKGSATVAAASNEPVGVEVAVAAR